MEANIQPSSRKISSYASGVTVPKLQKIIEMKPVRALSILGRC